MPRPISPEEFQKRKEDPFAMGSGTAVAQAEPSMLEPAVPSTPTPSTPASSGAQQSGTRRPISQQQFSQDVNRDFSLPKRPDPVLPTVTPTPDDTPSGWLDQHPWMKAGLDFATAGPRNALEAAKHPIRTAGEIKDLGVSMVKGVASTAVQLPQSLAGGALGLAEIGAGVAEQIGVPGAKEAREFTKKTRTDVMKPKQIPILGEVKALSAVPTDVADVGAQTPLETGAQAVDIALSVPAAKTAAAGAGAVKQTIAKRAENALLEYIQPALDKTGAKEALRSGRVAAGALKDTVEATPWYKEAAGVVKKFVNPSKKPVQNINNLLTEAGRISEKEVLPFLKANKKPFNVATFNKRLSDIEMPTAFKADKTLEGAYNLVRQRAVDVMNKHPKTMEGAWAARKEFDQLIKDEFGETVLDANSPLRTPAKRAARDIRREWNNFIADSTPETTFKEKMKMLNQIYDVADNIIDKNVGSLGKSNIKRLIDKHPFIAAALGGAATATIGGKALGIAGDVLLGE